VDALESSASHVRCDRTVRATSKALTPNDFPDLQAVAQRLADFGRDYKSIARPFEWKFTRSHLNALLAKMRSRYAQTLKLAA